MESPATICDWAEQTFGVVGSDLRVASRAGEEMAEAVRAYAAGRSTGVVALELADTMIVLCRLGKRLDMELVIPGDEEVAPLGLGRHLAEANEKMARLVSHLVYGVPPGWVMSELWRSLGHGIRACGTTAQEAIDAKMVVNRMREWKSDGTGHGYHVREKNNG